MSQIINPVRDGYLRICNAEGVDDDPGAAFLGDSGDPSYLAGAVIIGPAKPS